MIHVHTLSWWIGFYQKNNEQSALLRYTKNKLLQSVKKLGVKEDFSFQKKKSEKM